MFAYTYKYANSVLYFYLQAFPGKPINKDQPSKLLAEKRDKKDPSANKSSGPAAKPATKPGSKADPAASQKTKPPPPSVKAAQAAPKVKPKPTSAKSAEPTQTVKSQPSSAKSAATAPDSESEEVQKPADTKSGKLNAQCRANRLFTAYVYKVNSIRCIAKFISAF